MLHRVVGIAKILKTPRISVHVQTKGRSTMQAVRIHPSPVKDNPYSASNPAPSSALNVDTIEIPQPQEPNDIVVRIHATTIIRDTLTWPEMYAHPFVIPGHDYAGTIHSIHPNSQEDKFKVGDEVFGMVHADRGQCWAEYTLVKRDECSLKPKSLTWDEAATVPLSALTAWQALFVKGRIPLPSSLDRDNDGDATEGSIEDSDRLKVLITGASGGVGVWMVQLAKIAGCYVVAGTTSKTRSEEFLRSLGADEVMEYTELNESKWSQRFDTIIDAVAGSVLEDCWSAVKDNGTLVSIHSDSFEFVETHRRSSIARGKDNVKALFFIVEPSSTQLSVLSDLIDRGKLRTFVAQTYPLAEVRKVYDLCHSNSGGRGKAVLVP